MFSGFTQMYSVDVSTIHPHIEFIFQSLEIFHNYSTDTEPHDPAVTHGTCHFLPHLLELTWLRCPLLLIPKVAF